MIKKVSLEVGVNCPQLGCESADVEELDGPPADQGQRGYQCQTCGHQFTWEQSRFFSAGRVGALTALLDACVVEGRTETAIAEEIGVPQCHISRVITAATQEIADHEHHLKQLVHDQAADALATQGTYPLVETDESFISAQGRTYYPTQTVDQAGRLVHFAWLDRRSDKQLTQYLADLREVTGSTAIQCHDGYDGYHRCLNHILGEPIEIIHIHRHPKGRVLLVARERLPNCACTARHIVGLHTRGLHGPTPPIGYYAVQVTRCETHACQCDRDLCLADDHLYLCEPCQLNASQIQQEHQWRINRPQEVYKKGLLISWERPAQPGALPFIHPERWEDLPEPLRSWGHSGAQVLLGLVYQKFPTCCPTTNRIERQHARFKDHHEWRGCRKPKHVKAWFVSWIARIYFPTWTERLLTRIRRRISPKMIIWAMIRRIFPHLGQSKQETVN